jgi:hypothetical protein
MCSACCPLLGPSAGSALPSPGSFEASSPASTVLWRCATPWVPGTTLGCLRVALPGGVPVLSLPAVQTRGRGPGVRDPVPTTGINRLETGRASQVPGKPPSPICTGSSTPAGLHAPHRDGAAVRPPRGEQRRLLHWDFRSSIARLLGSLSTLRRVGRPTAVRKTRFQVLVRLSWAGLVTRKVSLKGFRLSSSSFPELYLARSPFHSLNVGFAHRP